MQKVNILGTEYEIIREAFEDETIDGFCDYTAHIIKVRNNNVSEVGDFEKLMKKQLRHEIIHAFLAESGLQATLNIINSSDMKKQSLTGSPFNFLKS